MKKKSICMKVCVHWIKADIMLALYADKIDLTKDTLRDIAKKIKVPNESAQVVKHHLEALVNMGTLQKINGQYAYQKNKVKTINL